MDLGEKGRGQMDSMMHRILLFILNNQSISAHVLMEEFYLSKNQLDYRIGKVNEFLQEKGFPVIIKSGSYYVLDIKKKYRQEILALEKAPVYYTAEERQIYILLLITLYEKFTLSGLAQKFRVSKNTILTDIKNLKILANRNGVGIRSARQTGYYLHGKEIEIRKLWTNLLKKEQEKDPTLLQSKSVLMIEHDLINEVSLRVEQLEKKMNVSFSEIKVSFLSMIIYLS
ncbi:helix-turn-helix domain-containing protein, partial [Enterococcus casseliflavus]